MAGQEQQPETCTHLLDLPAPILQSICANLDATSLARCASACKELHSACCDVLALLQAVSITTKRGSSLLSCSTPSTCLSRQISNSAYNREPHPPLTVPLDHSGHAALRLLATRCLHVRHLDLKGAFRWVDDEALQCLAHWGPRLHVLILDTCDKVTSEGLDAISHPMSSQTELQHLSLNSCGFRLGTGALECGSLTLETLRVCVGDLVHITGLSGISKSLVRANLRGCDLIDDSFCSRGPLPALHTLNLAFTSVGDRGLAALAQNCPALRSLHLAIRNNNIYLTGLYSEAGLLNFARRRPDVHVQFISA